MAAFFGVHTAGVGYDDDDPNRSSLVSNYPRSALNDASSRKIFVEAAEPDRKPVAPASGLPAAQPAAWSPPGRAPEATPFPGPTRPAEAARCGHPRAPPTLA